MNLVNIDGYVVSDFSKSTLDLQSGFCCTDTDSRKVIRWVGCKPSVFRSSVNMFSGNDLALCGWFQEVTTYNFTTVTLDPGQLGEVDMMGAKYLLVKAAWGDNILESNKLIEIGIPQQGGFIGSTIPFLIGDDINEIYQYQIMKDLFHLNSNSPLTNKLRLNNISPYSVSISMLYAK